MICSMKKDSPGSRVPVRCLCRPSGFLVVWNGSFWFLGLPHGQWDTLQKPELHQRSIPCNLNHNTNIPPSRKPPCPATSLRKRSSARFLSSPPRVTERSLPSYGLRVEEATLLTLEDLDLKNLHLRIHRLKHGVSSQKPLWRHTAELLGLLGLSRLKSLTPYINHTYQVGVFRHWRCGTVIIV